MQCEMTQGIDRERLSTEVRKVHLFLNTMKVDSRKTFFFPLQFSPRCSKEESEDSGTTGPSPRPTHRQNANHTTTAPVYAEIDYHKKNNAGTRRPGPGQGPPKVLLERKRFADGSVNVHGGSSAGSSPSDDVPEKGSDESSSVSNPVEKSRESKLDSSSVEMETPPSSSPRSPHASAPEMQTYPPIISDTDDLVAQGLQQCEEALRSLSNGPSSDVQEASPADRESLASSASTATTTTSSSAKKPPVYSSTPPVPKPRIRPGDEWHDYAEIYTPSGEKIPPWLSKTNGDVSGLTTKPPTPPLHRCPSWESRIYRVATSNEGFTVSGGVLQQNVPSPSPTPTRSPSVPIPPSLGILVSSGTGSLGPSRVASFGDVPSTPSKPRATSGSHLRRDDGYCPLLIPVFATVKGVRFICVQT